MQKIYELNEYFYESKISSLMKERKSQVDSLRRLVKELEDGDSATVTVNNILNHATVLMQVTAELDAYNMARQMNAVYNGDKD